MSDLKPLAVSGLVLLAVTGAAIADNDDHEADGRIEAVNQEAIQ